MSGISAPRKPNKRNAIAAYRRPGNSTSQIIHTLCQPKCASTLFPRLVVPRLTAVLSALAAVQAALATLLAHKTTAQNSETGCETASVLLLLRRGALLVHWLLLVLHGRRTLRALENNGNLIESLAYLLVTLRRTVVHLALRRTV